MKFSSGSHISFSTLYCRSLPIKMPTPLPFLLELKKPEKDLFFASLKACFTLFSLHELLPLTNLISDKKITSFFLPVIAAILVSRFLETPVRLSELQFWEPKVMEKFFVPKRKELFTFPFTRLASPAHFITEAC